MKRLLKEQKGARDRERREDMRQLQEQMKEQHRQLKERLLQIKEGKQVRREC